MESFNLEIVGGGGMLLGLAVLLVRAIVQNLPRIIDSASNAVRERETAKRLHAQTELAEVERETANDARIETLRDEVDALRSKQAETERLATEAIHSAQTDHARTAERLAVCEEDLARCTTEHAATKRHLNALGQELAAVRRDIATMRDSHV